MTQSKLFRFKKFNIRTSAHTFPVGTDAVLLGTVSPCTARTVLDVGAGSGLISLIIAQRNPLATISGIDIDGNTIKDLRANYEQSPFSERLNALKGDFLTFDFLTRKFDLIISNPPYHEEDTTSANTDRKRQRSINEDWRRAFVDRCAGLLAHDGYLSIIIPQKQATAWTKTAIQAGLHCAQSVSIKSFESEQAVRAILVFSNTPQTFTCSELAVYSKPGVYTPQFNSLTNDLYL